MKLKHIFVPTDFSHFSRTAISFAAELAREHGARITLFHGILLQYPEFEEEKNLHLYSDWEGQHEALISRKMENLHAEIKSLQIEVGFRLERGISTADIILEHLRSNGQYDLVIMGTHGVAGLKHIFLGSVAERISHFSPIPVLTVHRSVKRDHINKILAPIDFSHFCKTGADFAISLAQKSNAEICFLHIIEQEVHPQFYTNNKSSILDIDRGLKERVLQNMRRFLGDQLHDGIKCDFVVREGRAHQQIVQYSMENDFSLIIIGSQGLGGLDYTLMGSTAEKVIRWAKTSVLNVKSG